MKGKHRVWDEAPWFAIAKWKDGCCTEVFMTKAWNDYVSGWNEAISEGVEITAWCGTYREIEDFRRRCQSGRSR